MNIEDRDRAKRTLAKRPVPRDSQKNGSLQIKMILVAVGVVTLTWIGVLIYLGRELFARAFG